RLSPRALTHTKSLMRSTPAFPGHVRADRCRVKSFDRECVGAIWREPARARNRFLSVLLHPLGHLSASVGLIVDDPGAEPENSKLCQKRVRSRTAIGSAWR